MIFFNKSKKDNGNQIQGLWFSKSSIAYGNSIRNNPMIQDISAKMIQTYEKAIKSRINNADNNSIEITLSFSLSRAGVIFIREGDSQSIDVAYKDYGYAAIEDLEKRNGIAWVLQDILCGHIKRLIPELKNISAQYHEEYGWTKVDLFFTIETNIFKVL